MQYAADIPEGPVALESVRQGPHDDLLSAKQDTTFNEAGDLWVSEAEVKLDPERRQLIGGATRMPPFYWGFVRKPGPLSSNQ